MFICDVRTEVSSGSLLSQLPFRLMVVKLQARARFLVRARDLTTSPHLEVGAFIPSNLPHLLYFSVLGDFSAGPRCNCATLKLRQEERAQTCDPPRDLPAHESYGKLCSTRLRTSCIWAETLTFLPKADLTLLCLSQDDLLL